MKPILINSFKIVYLILERTIKTIVLGLIIFWTAEKPHPTIISYYRSVHLFGINNYYVAKNWKSFLLSKLKRKSYDD